MKKLVFILALAASLAASAAAWAATPVGPGTTSWTTGEYVVDTDVMVGDRVTVTGDVVLILNDGCTLSADSGICLTGENSLTIKTPDGSHGTGRLAATGRAYDAGIGGSAGQSGGRLTIAGGWVTAVGGSSMGGGGAGIGGGGSMGGHSGGVITITGGVVSAIAGQESAGIGGSPNGGSGTITITGGVVSAAAGTGAAIGGGYNGTGDTITISGGFVIASAESGAGIGGGRRGDSGHAPGGTLESTSDGSAWIVPSMINSDTSGFVSGVIFYGDAGYVYGSPTIQQAPEYSVPDGATLTVSEDSTLTNESVLKVEGEIDLLGYIVNNGEIRLKDMDVLRALTHGGRVTGTGEIAVGGEWFSNGGFEIPSPEHEADAATIEEYVVGRAGLSVDRHNELLPELALEAISESGLVLDGTAAANTITPLKIVSVDVKDGSIAAVIFDNISGRALVSGDEPVSVDLLNIVKVTAKGRAVRLAPTDDGEADGTYAISRHGAPVRTVRAASDDYKLAVFITDDGDLDLAKGVKGVVDPLVLVKSTGASPHDGPTSGGGGSCGVGLGAAAIAALALVIRCKQRRA